MLWMVDHISNILNIIVRLTMGYIKTHEIKQKMQYMTCSSLLVIIHFWDTLMMTLAKMSTEKRAPEISAPNHFWWMTERKRGRERERKSEVDKENYIERREGKGNEERRWCEESTSILQSDPSIVKAQDGAEGSSQLCQDLWAAAGWLNGVQVWENPVSSAVSHPSAPMETKLLKCTGKCNLAQTKESPPCANPPGLSMLSVSCK